MNKIIFTFLILLKPVLDFFFLYSFYDKLINNKHIVKNGSGQLAFAFFEW